MLSFSTDIEAKGKIRLIHDNTSHAVIPYIAEQKGLAHAGANFNDVVRSTTYVTDIMEYYKHSDERFKYFKDSRPASTLIEISRLGPPDAMIEIEVEAIIEPERLKNHQ